jgi:hypothetical protein
MSPISIICDTSTVIQGAVAIIFIADRFSKKLEGEHMTSKGKALVLAILLVLGAVTSGSLGVWMYTHPAPIIKPCPVCAPPQSPQPCQQKTGNARTKGNNSAAVTGNGNIVSAGEPTSKSDKKE